MSGLYLHVPFCSRICPYCDFAVLAGPERLRDDWGEGIVGEGRERCGEERWSGAEFRTVYWGGGTPSSLSPDLLERVSRELFRIFSIDPARLREVTLEANPESVDRERIARWKEIGIDRVSLGIQSLNDAVLRNIGRNHTSAQALRAFDLLSESGLRVTADLMFSLPGQRLDHFEADLTTLLDRGGKHLSFYGLGIEEGTLFGQRAARGELPVDDDLYCSFYTLGEELCRSRGVFRYEVSNFAVPGEESLHNRSYWNGTPYLGLGPGAHSYDGEGRREGNPKKFSEWLRGVRRERGPGGKSVAPPDASSDGERCAVREKGKGAEPKEWRSIDLLTSTDRTNERLWLSLRQSDGLPVSEAEERGISPERLHGWEERGMVERSGGRWRIVGEGWLRIDAICADLFLAE